MLTTIRCGRPRALVIALLIWGSAAAAAPALAHAASVDARVTGTFSMRARVTTAVHVRGEHAGEVVTRRWVVDARGCHGDVCERLLLRRQRSDHQHSTITLYRVGPGRYKGHRAFYLGLSCGGRVYRHSSRVPYTITLTVASATDVGGVEFARMLTATYVNPYRTDRTPCPLGPSHDAGRYSGHLTSRLPAAPVPAFSATVDDLDDTASFTNLSRPGSARLVAQFWYFGDRASGAADTSTLEDPTHRFTAPGTYFVTLAEVDANGLSSTTTEAVTVSGLLTPLTRAR